MKRIPILALLVAALAPAQAAHAELVGEFSARLKNIKPSYGAYTAVFESRIYEVSGAPPPQLTRAEIRFPRGAAIRNEFLVSKFFCDEARVNREQSAASCELGHFGTGRLLLDGRPVLADAVSADIDLYLTASRQPGAVTSVLVVVHANERTPVWDFQTLTGNLFPDSGKFGFRLELPTKIRPLVPNLRLSLAELSLTIRGLTLKRPVRRCVRRGRGGRCVAKRAGFRKLFWTKVPKCLPKGKVTFEADYAFAQASPIVKQKTVRCRRFLKRPSTHGKGNIPGT